MPITQISSKVDFTQIEQVTKFAYTYFIEVGNINKLSDTEQQLIVNLFAHIERLDDELTMFI